VLPTATGIQLIGTIQNDLVKSAELTGSWEKQKDIEKELLPLQRLSTT
jgi:DNA topoisomerase-3